MGEYGYAYRGYSNFNAVRGETRGPVIKPFVPSIPNTNNNSEGNVTKKRIVPVGSSRPYGDDDYNKHSPQTEAYPIRVDDKRYPQTSPGRESPRKAEEFLTKLQNEASRPPWFPPMTSTDWRQSPQPTPYNNGANGYADYGNGSNNEGRKPVASTIRNDSYDGYNGTNDGYGDHGINKEGRKPVGSTIRNDNYDGYYNGTNGYGDYGSNKDGRKPVASTIRNDNYDGYNGTNGYGDYGSNKEGRNPIGGTIRNDNHDGYYNGTNDGYGDYGNYGNKEGRKPIGSTIRNDNYGGYNGPNGYGEYNNKEGRKPFGSTLRNENYGGNDYGDYNNKEVQRPKYSSGWTEAPRKGTQLSEPTHDIGKAIELLKQAAKVTSNNNNEHSNKGGHKATVNGSWLGESTNKNMVTGPPRYADYRDASIIDSRNAEKIFKGKKV